MTVARPECAAAYSIRLLVSIERRAPRDASEPAPPSCSQTIVGSYSTEYPPSRAGHRVLVLAVHEEALVEAADLLECSAANEEAGPCDPFDGVGLSVRTRIADHLIDPARARHEPLQEQRPRIR